MPETMAIEVVLQEVKDELGQLRGQLERLSSAIWRDIDHDDPTRLEAGVRFKQGYNERRAALEETLERMLVFLREYPHPGTGTPQDESIGETPTGEMPEEKSASDTQVEQEERPANIDTVSGAPTDAPAAATSVATGLDQKVPFGFILGDQSFSSASTWRLFYEALLQELYSRGPDKLSDLARSPGQFVQGGRPLFARVPDPLSDPLPIADAVFAESEMPPAALLGVIKRLVGYLGYPLESFKIHLKEKNRGTLETLSLAP